MKGPSRKGQLTKGPYRRGMSLRPPLAIPKMHPKVCIWLFLFSKHLTIFIYIVIYNYLSSHIYCGKKVWNLTCGMHNQHLFNLDQYLFSFFVYDPTKSWIFPSIYSLRTHKTWRLGQWHGFQNTTLTTCYYKNIYEKVIYVYFYESIFQDKFIHIIFVFANSTT